MTLDLLADQWTKLGAGYLGPTDVPTPDLERLILDTARHAHRSPRLLTVALTWLSRYSSLVAEHRLVALVKQELEPEFKPSLGLILDLAASHSRRHDRRRNLYRAMKSCSKAAESQPYFDVERKTKGLRERAKRRASEVSKRWNLWVEPLELKYDALRPSNWIIDENPKLAFRADFKGDLRASILLLLEEDPASGISVSELGRRCHASRTAVLKALEDLELGNHIRRHRESYASASTLLAA